MKNLITSKEVQNILNINRPELHTLCKFEVLKPKRLKVNKFLYDLNEVEKLVIVKDRVKVNSGLCKNS